MDNKTYSVKSIQDKIKTKFVAIKFNPELSATYVYENKSYSGEALIIRF